MELTSSNRCFNGEQRRYQHRSARLNCDMTFSVFLPHKQPVAVLYWLSGLTCTDENFVHKAGAQRVASELGLVIITPDTSPRGQGVPDDENGAYDFGLGAGFYLNAKRAPWNQHYQMEAYIVEELPALINVELALKALPTGIFGHSMGGHGALTLALRYPEIYQSVSAFAPICAATQCPWGEKALAGYLGQDRHLWKQYDAVALILQSQNPLALLIDQGSADPFLDTQLKPDLLQQACAARGFPLKLRMHAGYDHSYFFIASFIEDHLRWHSEQLLS